MALLAVGLSCAGVAAEKAPVSYVLSARQRPILTDCSGVAYRPETKTYFIIENRMGNVFEINAARRILAMYPTGLTRDTEGITYAGNGIFYICAEARNEIFEVELKDGQFRTKRQVRLDDKLPKGPVNAGLEGIAYCRPRNSLFCVKEREPAMLLEVALAGEDFGKILRQMEVTSVRDLAGAAYDETSGRLLLLSEMDKVVLVVDPASLKVYGSFPVEGPQPEGICRGDGDTLCIVSEPTYCLFYKPGKPEASKSAPPTAARPLRTPPPAKPAGVIKPVFVFSFDTSLTPDQGPAAPVGTYPLVPGRKGKAVDLTAEKTNLSVQADGLLDGNDLAFEFWFKPTWSAPGKNTYELLRIAGTNRAFMILEYNGNSGALQIEIHTRPGFLSVGGGVSGLITAGQWHHVAARWKVEGSNRVAANLALNGKVLSNRAQIQKWPQKGFDLTTCRVNIGSMGGRSIRAVVDEFKIGR